MSIPSLKARISFQAKILIPVVAVMVLLTAAAMWVVNRRITTQAEQAAAAQLETAKNVFNEMQDIRHNVLASRYHNLVNEPRCIAITKTGDADTAKDFLEKYWLQEDGVTAGVIIISGMDGKTIAVAQRGSWGGATEVEAGSRHAIHEALAGRTSPVGTIAAGNKVVDIICVPVRDVTDARHPIIGAVTFGDELRVEDAADLKKVTGSDIVFLQNGRVVTSTLAQPEGFPQLFARFDELKSNPARADRHLPLNREHFLCAAGQISGLEGDGGLGYLLLSSYEKPLVALRSTQYTLLRVGLIGILASTVVLWFLILKITQPLRRLRDTVEAVGQGDYSKRVEVSSQDECGELARAFNQMTENIKASNEELEKTVETLKSTQNQLIQSEKLSGIGEFVSGVAHELNNPLTSVMGFAELLGQSDLPEQQRRYMEIIAKSAKRCQKIVQSLLSFARRHAPERKVVCVNDVVRSAVEILEYQMRTSGIEVEWNLDTNLPATLLDPHQMQQVFLNLVNNARQAMEDRPSPGRLRITTESEDDRVRVIFQDNGPGIPLENLKRIFNPFFTTKEVGKGTGLGLSLCYGIITEHGGAITPYSEPGVGATFVVELPITRNPAAKAEIIPQPSPAPNNATEGAGRKVLVIDDEDSILQMVREVLTLNGYQVEVATNGESAIEQLSRTYYDLALCDWKMPGLGGQQIYERMRATKPEIARRMIFFTGDVVSEKAQDFLRARNKICLSKPFALADFRAAISRVLSAA